MNGTDIDDLWRQCHWEARREVSARWNELRETATREQSHEQEDTEAEKFARNRRELKRHATAFASHGGHWISPVLENQQVTLQALRRGSLNAWNYAR